MSDKIDLADVERRMKGALNSVKQDFAGLRTGRASATMLDPIQVDAYGSTMPINQLANVSVPEARMISVQVWDAGLVQAVEKAIRESDLGLNPAVEGSSLRIVIPELNEERRQEITKVAAKYAEQARVAIRNVRRDGMEFLKKLEKDSEISQDEQHGFGAKIQELTDSTIKEVDELLSVKEKEIMQI